MDEKKNIRAIEAGTLLGYYQVIEKIGSGGMGEVYLALDTKLNRNVAIKVLLDDWFDDTEKIARFKREALTVASINHANIMSVYDFDEVELKTGQKIHFIVMEYIEGELLDGYLSSRPNRSISDLLRVAEKLSSGLVAAHQKGVIHRDIKMSNVIVNNDNVPKILDFGLAKPVEPVSMNEASDEVSEKTESIIHELTQEGKIVGTVLYMAPEQTRGASVDLRSDIFSLGVLMYKMFTSKFPFEGTDNVSVIAKILEAPHQSVRQVREELPSELERIIDKCLQKNPKDRYQDTRDLMLDLRNLRKQFESGITDSITGQFDLKAPGSKKFVQKRARLVGAAIALLAVSFSVYFLDPFSLFNSEVVAETRALAILDFENLSDINDKDRMGQILQEILITDLSESGQVKVISSQRLFDIQNKLGFNGRNKIDRSIAAEVARKSGAVTMLSGNLINTGPDWLVTGQLIDVEKGTVIKSHRIKGADIYAIIDSLSEYILTDLSLSTDKIAIKSGSDDTKKISMRAYRHYFAGIDYLSEADYYSAINEFVKAVEIDENFSKAYYKLTIALWWQTGVQERQDAEEILKLIKERKFTTTQDELLVEAALSLFENRYGDAQLLYRDLAVKFPDNKEVWYGLGEGLYHYGDNTKRQALDAFEKAVELDVSFGLAYRHIFELYLKYEMNEKAYAAASALVKENPESLIGFRYLAITSIYIKDSSRIRKSEKEALKYHTTEDDLLRLYSELVSAYVDVKDYDKALAYYQRALVHNKSNSSLRMLELWGTIVKLYEKEDQEEAADSVYQLALRSTAPHARKLNMITNRVQRYFSNVHTRKKAHLLLEQGFELDTADTHVYMYAVAAQLYLGERDYVMSIQNAEKAIEIGGDGENGWPRNVLFNAVLMSKDYVRAEKLAKENTKKNTSLTASSYERLLSVYIYSGKFDKADKLVSDVLEKDTTEYGRTYILNSAGVAYRIIGEKEKAAKVLERALKLKPDAWSSVVELARCYINNGDHEKGLKLANLLLENEDFNSSGLMQFSRSYLIQKKYVDAATWISKMDTTQSSALRMHGYYHSETRQFDSALSYAEMAYEMNPEFFSINLLGYLKVAGDFDISAGLQLAEDAIKSPPPYSQVDTYIKESPFVPLPQHTLGLGYYKKGDFAEARKYLEEAAKLRPDDSEIREDLRKCLESMTN